MHINGQFNFKLYAYFCDVYKCTVIGMDIDTTRLSSCPNMNASFAFIGKYLNDSTIVCGCY